MLTVVILSTPFCVSVQSSRECSPGYQGRVIAVESTSRVRFCAQSPIKEGDRLVILKFARHKLRSNRTSHNDWKRRGVILSVEAAALGGVGTAKVLEGFPSVGDRVVPE